MCSAWTSSQACHRLCYPIRIPCGHSQSALPLSMFPVYSAVAALKQRSWYNTSAHKMSCSRLCVSRTHTHGKHFKRQHTTHAPCPSAWYRLSVQSWPRDPTDVTLSATLPTSACCTGVTAAYALRLCTTPPLHCSARLVAPIAYRKI